MENRCDIHCTNDPEPRTEHDMIVSVDATVTDIFATDDPATELAIAGHRIQTEIAGRIKEAFMQRLSASGMDEALPADLNVSIHGETTSQTRVWMPGIMQEKYAIRVQLVFLGVLSSPVPINSAQAMRAHVHSLAEMAAAKAITRMKKDFLHINETTDHIPGEQAAAQGKRPSKRSDAEKN